MSTYRFCGDTGILHLSTGDIACSQFGEKVELADEQAAALIATNAPIFPEAEFEKFQFTAEELSDNPSASAHHLASADFQRKKSQLIDALVRRIIEMRKPSVTAVGTVKPVAPAPKVSIDVPAAPVAVAPAKPAAAAADAKPTETPVKESSNA